MNLIGKTAGTLAMALALAGTALSQESSPVYEEDVKGKIEKEVAPKKKEKIDTNGFVWVFEGMRRKTIKMVLDSIAENPDYKPRHTEYVETFTDWKDANGDGRCQLSELENRSHTQSLEGEGKIVFSKRARNQKGKPIKFSIYDREGISIANAKLKPKTDDSIVTVYFDKKDLSNSNFGGFYMVQWHSENAPKETDQVESMVIKLESENKGVSPKKN